MPEKESGGRSTSQIKNSFKTNNFKNHIKQLYLIMKLDKFRDSETTGLNPSNVTLNYSSKTYLKKVRNFRKYMMPWKVNQISKAKVKIFLFFNNFRNFVNPKIVGNCMLKNCFKKVCYFQEEQLTIPLSNARET